MGKLSLTPEIPENSAEFHWLLVDFGAKWELNGFEKGKRYKVPSAVRR